MAKTVYRLDQVVDMIREACAQEGSQYQWATKHKGDCNLLGTRMEKKLNLITFLAGIVVLWTVTAGDAMSHGLSPIATATCSQFSWFRDMPCSIRDWMSTTLSPLEWFGFSVVFLCDVVILMNVWRAFRN